jgi:hypothetical protein
MNMEVNTLDRLNDFSRTLLFIMIVAATTWTGLIVFFGLVTTFFIY